MNTVSTRITGATAILSSSFRINSNALILFPHPIVPAAFERTVPPVFHRPLSLPAALCYLDFLIAAIIGKQYLKQFFRRRTETPIHTVTGIPLPCDPKMAAPALQHFFLPITVQIILKNIQCLFKSFYSSSAPLWRSLLTSIILPVSSKDKDTDKNKNMPFWISPKRHISPSVPGRIRTAGLSLRSRG